MATVSGSGSGSTSRRSASRQYRYCSNARRPPGRPPRERLDVPPRLTRRAQPHLLALGPQKARPGARRKPRLQAVAGIVRKLAQRSGRLLGIELGEEQVVDFLLVELV